MQATCRSRPAGERHFPEVRRVIERRAPSQDGERDTALEKAQRAERRGWVATRPCGTAAEGALNAECRSLYEVCR